MTNPTRFLKSQPIAAPIKSARGLLGLAVGLASAWLLLSGGALHAQEKDDLTKLSVDDLMNVEVTSVARKGQKLSETPAAVFVITQEDIRRSGATTIPEILRIVPGLDVARVSANTWAVSARGFNHRFANKMLVLIDGRKVYSALSAGVYWDVQDTLIEDIERIEVIRGPGGTLWGANAVNGIINIITKHAIDTQGTLMSAGAGTEERSLLAARHGGSFGSNAYYRGYAKSFDRPATVDPSGLRRFDGWDAVRAGFRTDWATRGGDTFTAQGDIYRGTSDQMETLVNPAEPLAGAQFDLNHVAGGNILLRWSQTQSSRSDTSLQVFYDYTRRNQLILDDTSRILDLDFQHHLKLGRNDIVWGAQTQATIERTSSPQHQVNFAEARDLDRNSSTFIQDEIRVSDRLHLTVGSKLVYTHLKRFDLQPTVRGIFSITPRQAIWAAATSAVRSPSFNELDARVNVRIVDQPGGTPALLIISGNPNLRSERVNTCEIGYRWMPGSAMSFDVTAFHNDLKRIVNASMGQPYAEPSGQVIIPFSYGNNVEGHSDGAELFATYTTTPNWNLTLGYAFFQSHLVGIENNSPGPAPAHQVQLRSFLNLPRRIELNTAVYYVGRIPDLGGAPAYIRFDTALTWRPVPAWGMSINGQNLLRSHHNEFEGVSALGAATPVQRSVYGKVTWRF